MQHLALYLPSDLFSVTCTHMLKVKSSSRFLRVDREVQQTEKHRRTFIFGDSYYGVRVHSGKHNVTFWRPSVCLSVCPVGILARGEHHATRLDNKEDLHTYFVLQGCELWSACLLVDLLPCLKNIAFVLHQIFCACYLWPWLGPPPKAVRPVMYFLFCGCHHVFVYCRE